MKTKRDISWVSKHLSGDLAAVESQYLELEYQASEPLLQFIYGSRERALFVQKELFRDGVSEFCSPFGQALVVGDRVLGIAACLTGRELARCRLMTAARLATLKGVKRDSQLLERLCESGRCMLNPKDDDFYLSRIAVAQEARGCGIGRSLMQWFESEGQRRSCGRLVLDVCSIHREAIRLYRRLGFEELERSRLYDESGGSSLEYFHLQKIVMGTK
jgi:ribosomal protein S18 acetylase RimI-like enzyme